ncbi:hypothetical protein WMY93_031736 [Mugilogobius chulae]|uniref:Uncharacterized protein n=1 Tax=Mugilogobius chulae TaxID=88201 RepID=A0AAW0MM18_9GOBI
MGFTSETTRRKQSWPVGQICQIGHASEHPLRDTSQHRTSPLTKAEVLPPKLSGQVSLKLEEDKIVCTADLQSARRSDRLRVHRHRRGRPEISHSPVQRDRSAGDGPACARCARRHQT